mmetsp:Transcript_44363/g.86836  ORF Transcript_44363/g.86836 Transcript_44363/m.86836 type:complete len:111 (+) Transcript_44363:1760-2092(+)
MKPLPTTQPARATTAAPFVVMCSPSSPANTTASSAELCAATAAAATESKGYGPVTTATASSLLHLEKWPNRNSVSIWCSLYNTYTPMYINYIHIRRYWPIAVFLSINRVR